MVYNGVYPTIAYFTPVVSIMELTELVTNLNQLVTKCNRLELPVSWCKKRTSSSKRLKMSYEELLDKLENGTPQEKLDAELEILGRFYYLND